MRARDHYENGNDQMMRGERFTFYSGTWTKELEAAAERNPEAFGLLITPLTWDSLQHKARRFRGRIAFDNGVFSKTTKFDPDRFRAFLEAAADLADRVEFVVAPDVVGNARETLDQFSAWSEEIRGLGYRVAFAAQDGLEKLLSEIPWDAMDCLFVGGSTEWKIGDIENRLGRGYWNWLEMHRTAESLEIPVHMGRVNSWKRAELAGYSYSCSSADGNILSFGPTANWPRVESWVRKLNGHLYRAA